MAESRTEASVREELANLAPEKLQAKLYGALQAAGGVERRLDGVPEVRSAVAHARDADEWASEYYDFTCGEPISREEREESEYWADRAWKRVDEVREKWRPEAERQEAVAEAHFREVSEFCAGVRPGEQGREERVVAVEEALERRPELERTRAELRAVIETSVLRLVERDEVARQLQRCSEDAQRWRAEHRCGAWLHDHGLACNPELLTRDAVVEVARSQLRRADEAWRAEWAKSTEVCKGLDGLRRELRVDVVREYGAREIEREGGRNLQPLAVVGLAGRRESESGMEDAEHARDERVERQMESWGDRER